jgi:hypothetical protein
MHNLRLVLLGLAACTALILGWSFLQQAARLEDSRVETADRKADAPSATDRQSTEAIEAERRAIETKLADTPDYLRFFNQLKLVFPGEYDSIMDSLAKKSLPLTEAPNADLLMSEAVRALRLSRGALAAKADTPALNHVFDMQLAMMRALSGDEDQRLCVDFLYGGASRAFFRFSAANRSLMTDMALAGLDAISDGSAKKLDRPAPNDADFQLLEKALTDKGLKKAEIDAVLDGKAADPPIDDARMCQVGQIYLQTLANLPEGPRLRIYALAVELMARS